MSVKRPLPCLHLGPIVKPIPCNCRRKDWRRCELGLTQPRLPTGLVTQTGACEACPRYEVDPDELPEEVHES